VEQYEHESASNAWLFGETIAVAPSDAFGQAVDFHLAKEIMELNQNRATNHDEVLRFLKKR
jgi:hypothetical protein